MDLLAVSSKGFVYLLSNQMWNTSHAQFKYALNASFHPSGAIIGCGACACPHHPFSHHCTLHSTGEWRDIYSFLISYVAVAPRSVAKSTRWRMVGRPWGQFQGESSPASWCSILVIFCLLSAVPIMTEDRHAREASMERTRDGRTPPPPPTLSEASRPISSSTSEPKHPNDLSVRQCRPSGGSFLLPFFPPSLTCCPERDVSAHRHSAQTQTAPTTLHRLNELEPIPSTRGGGGAMRVVPKGREW